LRSFLAVESDKRPQLDDPVSEMVLFDTGYRV